MTSGHESALLDRGRSITLAVFDVDGVMTDGRFYLDNKGVESKAFHTRDGLGLKALMQHDIEVAVITARQSQLVSQRMAELGIRHVLQGRHDKLAAMTELLGLLGTSFEQAAYAGDDLVDWPAMRQCRLKCTPADGNAWIRQRADLVTGQPGGHGAVREICEFILEARGVLSAWQDSFQ